MMFDSIESPKAVQNQPLHAHVVQPSTGFKSTTTQTWQSQCVVLLHGLGRTPFSMIALARDFRAAGFIVVNQAYPSRTQSLPELSKFVAVAISKCNNQTPNATINFVTHSMGAIVLRQYFANLAHTSLMPKTIFGRAVLLGPPNHGSEIVDAWGKKWWYRLILGPAGSSLSTAEHDAPKVLPSLPFAFAVIAGDSASKNWLLPDVSIPSDGKVSVASAALVDMRAIKRVPVSHTWLPNNQVVRSSALKFIETGSF